MRKRNVFTKYGETAREVLEALLDKYADEGVATIESIEVLRVQPLDTAGHARWNSSRASAAAPQYLQALRARARTLRSQ